MEIRDIRDIRDVYQVFLLFMYLFLSFSKSLIQTLKRLHVRLIDIVVNNAHEDQLSPKARGRGAPRPRLLRQHVT